ALGVPVTGAWLPGLVGQPLIAMIMVPLGLGALIRGATALAFAGVSSRIAWPGLAEPIVVGGVAVAPDKLVAASVAVLCTALVAWLFHGSRTGIALRAIADAQPAAMAARVDPHRRV